MTTYSHEPVRVFLAGPCLNETDRQNETCYQQGKAICTGSRAPYISTANYTSDNVSRGGRRWLASNLPGSSTSQAQGEARRHASLRCTPRGARR
jgi:hypothetical protein